MTCPLQTLLGNLAVPVVKAPVITLKDKDIKRESWHAAWRLMVLKKVKSYGKEKGTAIYLSTSTGFLMAWPGVFVKICNIWVESSECYDRSIIQMVPRLFCLLFVLQPHTYFQEGFEAPVFRGNIRQGVITGAAWDLSWPLCHPNTEKKPISFISQTTHCCSCLCFGLKELFCVWKRKVSMTSFFTGLSVGYPSFSLNRTCKKSPRVWKE